MASNPTRVACIGASITFGLGLANRRQECYPAVLGQRLGDGYQVRNFGYSGATAGRETNEPYWQTPSFTSATRFEPQIALLAFGTNDAQHVNLPNLPRFQEDYVALVAHFRTLDSRPKILVASPAPVFEPLPEIDIPTLDNVIRPTIEEVAPALGIPVIDAYQPLVDRTDWFADNLHPNADGARLLAELAHAALREHGLAG